MIKGIKILYPALHWLTAIILSSLLDTLYDAYIDDIARGGGFEYFKFLVYISFIVSSPIFLVNLIVFNVMMRRNSSAFAIKSVLNAIPLAVIMGFLIIYIIKTSTFYVLLLAFFPTVGILASSMMFPVTFRKPAKIEYTA